MSRPTRILAVVSTLGLVGYALFVLLDGPSGVDEDAFEDPSDMHARAESRERMLDHARGVKPSSYDPWRRDGQVREDDHGMAGLEGDEADARRGFDHIMREVESLGAGRRRLSQDEWRETYRAANDAFSALSMHLDARTPHERAELEQAYTRLKEGLARVRVRGDKFGYP